MATTTKSGIQKYQSQSKKTAKTTAAEKPEVSEKAVKAAKVSAKEAAAAANAIAAKAAAEAKVAANAIAAKGTANAKATPGKNNTAAKVSADQVAAALNALAESKQNIEKEVALQKELAKELVQETAHTNKLVAGDFSPVNMKREQLIVEYAGLIKFIAQKIAARLPSNIELDDLISSGCIGLMDAIEKYDHTRIACPGLGTSFDS